MKPTKEPTQFELAMLAAIVARREEEPLHAIEYAWKLWCDLWHDFATNEAGDAVDFFQRATGLSAREACLKFLEMTGGHHAPAKITDAKPKPVFPQFRQGTAADFQHLASLRNIGREGIQWASERGLLWFATLKNHPAWIVADAAHLNAQARRMDGQEWEHIGAKAWTLPGAWASWPIGISEARPFRAIALCEGGPDFLAAHYLALWERDSQHAKMNALCAPVAMLGASLKIHADASRCLRPSVFASSAMMMQRARRRWNVGPRNWHP